ncbi:hypothetical protein CSUI_008357, partial [Cystoisospora suis]
MIVQQVYFLDRSRSNFLFRFLLCFFNEVVCSMLLQLRLRCMYSSRRSRRCLPHARLVSY